MPDNQTPTLSLSQVALSSEGTTTFRSWTRNINVYDENSSESDQNDFQKIDNFAAAISVEVAAIPRVSALASTTATAELSAIKIGAQEYKLTAESGVSDYTCLTNKPQINGVTLIGDKSFTDLDVDETVIGNGLHFNNDTLSVQLYQHNFELRFSGTSIYLHFSFINSSNTAFTAATLKSYLIANFLNIDLLCSGKYYYSNEIYDVVLMNEGSTEITITAYSEPSISGLGNTITVALDIANAAIEKQSVVSIP